MAAQLGRREHKGRVEVREAGILACWGSPMVPQSRKEFSIIPPVLDADISVTRKGVKSVVFRGRGLAEYFNAEL